MEHGLVAVGLDRRRTTTMSPSAMVPIAIEGAIPSAFQVRMSLPCRCAHVVLVFVVCVLRIRPESCGRALG